MTKRTYYTLLVRDNAAEPWGIHNGDYSRADVVQERADVTYREYKKGNTMIITTDDDQASVNAAVALLNAKGA